MLEHIIFYIFATLLVLSACMVITVRNPVHAALFLVLSFFCSAAIWLLLQAEFLAIVLILVYVGAVMVLFLFVVMMLDINYSELRAGFIKYLPVGILVSVLMATAMGFALNTEYFSTVETNIGASTELSNTERLGLELFTRYLYPFEIAGAILLVAMIAAITLTFRGKKSRHQQVVDKQVTTKRSERIRLVNLESEPRKE